MILRAGFYRLWFAGAEFGDLAFVEDGAVAGAGVEVEAGLVEVLSHTAEPAGLSVGLGQEKTGVVSAPQQGGVDDLRSEWGISDARI